MVGGQAVYFPLKLNPGGVMPIIFAVSLMAVPQTVLKFPALGKFDWAKNLAATSPMAR